MEPGLCPAVCASVAPSEKSGKQPHRALPSPSPARSPLPRSPPPPRSPLHPPDLQSSGRWRRSRCFHRLGAASGSLPRKGKGVGSTGFLPPTSGLAHPALDLVSYSFLADSGSHFCSSQSLLARGQRWSASPCPLKDKRVTS